MPIIAGRASAAYGAGFAAVTTVPYAGPFGSYDSLATLDVGATAISTIDFATIPTGYKHLQVRYIARNTSTGYFTGGACYMRFNYDTTGAYSFHSLRGTGNSGAGSFTGQNSTGNSLMYLQGNTGSGSSNTKAYGIAVIDIFDYSSNAKNKVIRVLGGEDGNGSGLIDIDSGAYYSTNPVTSIQISNGPFAVNSQFALYGVK
jgi:hypothetical protein